MIEVNIRTLLVGLVPRTIFFVPIWCVLATANLALAEKGQPAQAWQAAIEFSRLIDR
jgi:hypothetical protein